LTSTAPSEGKTTIALSIAGSAATSGLKVLVIDADLRHPSASRVLNLHKERGLVDLLLGQVNVQEVLKLHEEGGYWVLPAGNKTQNPPDLLGSERMKSLVAGFRQTFDMIIIDTPPAGPVIDPVVVSQLSDKIVLIVRWAVTPREMVKQCVQQLSGHKKIAGVAFNHVNEQQAQKYGKYAYSYYYGSRYYKKYYTE
jgi:capsular exopolysaccharide synthesis family protein